MGFQVKPFREVLAMTDEQLDETLAPIRARSAKAKADMAVARLDEQLVTIERSIHEQCASKDINFDTVVGQIDNYELTERKREQIKGLIAELFPEGE